MHNDILYLMNKMRRKRVNVFLPFLIRFIARKGGNSIPSIPLFSHKCISLAFDKQDGNGFQLEKTWPTFSS